MMTIFRRVTSRSFARTGRLIARLALCGVVVGLLVVLANAEATMHAIQGAFARIAGSILVLFGEEVVIDGNAVWSERFGISVVTACTGLFLTGLFTTAVIVFPTALRSKLVGIVMGVTGIFTLNVVRLVSLYYVGVHMPKWLDTIHLLVWQSLLIALSVALWLLWAGLWGRGSGAEAAR